MSNLSLFMELEKVFDPEILENYMVLAEVQNLLLNIAIENIEKTKNFLINNPYISNRKSWPSLFSIINRLIRVKYQNIELYVDLLIFCMSNDNLSKFSEYFRHKITKRIRSERFQTFEFSFYALFYHISRKKNYITTYFSIYDRYPEEELINMFDKSDSRYLIRTDNIIEFQKYASLPSFNPMQVFRPRHELFIKCTFYMYSYVTLAAAIPAPKCFNYLISNFPTVLEETDLLYFAIMGGDSEIIRTLMKNTISHKESGIAAKLLMNDLYIYMLDAGLIQDHFCNMNIIFEAGNYDLFLEMVQRGYDIASMSFYRSIIVSDEEFVWLIMSNQKFDVNYYDMVGDLLYFAVSCCKHRIAKAILDHPKYVTGRLDFADRTPLVLYLLGGGSDKYMFDVLFDHPKTDINVYYKGYPLLFLVAKCRNEYFNRFLLHEIIDLNLCDHHNDNILNFLIKIKSDLFIYIINHPKFDGYNVKNQNGYAPLMQAIVSKFYKAVDYLIIHDKVDINCCDKYGRNALHEVCTQRNKELFWLLIKNGCNVNKQSTRGRTPLHVAAKKKFVFWDEDSSFEGFDFNIKDRNQQTPKDIAWSYKLQDKYFNQFISAGFD